MTKILDPRTGLPFEPLAVQETQIDSAKLGSLHQRFDQHPSSGLTPYRLANILQDAERHQLTDQAELAADMEEKDGHLFAEMQKRKLALTTVKWQIEPPYNANIVEKKAAEVLTERLANIDMAEVILDMSDGILKGYSAQTIKWQLVEKMQMPIAIEHVPASWFTTANDDRNKLQLIDDTGQGQALWAGGWIMHHHKSKSGYLGRSGLVRTLAWPYLFKNYSLRDLAEFLEIYGLPLRLGKYPSGATEQEKGRLLQAVVEIGHNAAGIIPESMTLDFKEAAKGQADPFLAMVAWAEKTVSKAILGATLTSQADGTSSTNALGNVHNEVRHDIRDADLRQIANTLTRDLLWPMVVFNLNGISSFHRCPKFVFNTAEAGDIKLLSEALPGLQKSGMKISRKWLHESTQIPLPEDESDILKPIVGADTATLTAEKHHQGCSCSGCQSVAVLTAETTVEDPVQKTPSDIISHQLQVESDNPQTEFVDKIRDLVNKAESFEQLKNDLLALAGQNKSKQAELIEQAMVLAELQGRSDVLDEALNVL
ncbi:MAG: DUF935 domain-containing protein [Gammaproteobacteria bacterium]|nr:DUF935 domain-containing protein [Gammaproteobacteria bacterium]